MRDCRFATLIKGINNSPKPGHPVQNAGAFDSGSPGDGHIQTVIFFRVAHGGCPQVIGHAADHENPQLMVLAPAVELGPNSSQTSMFHF